VHVRALIEKVFGEGAHAVDLPALERTADQDDRKGTPRLASDKPGEPAVGNDPGVGFITAAAIAATVTDRRVAPIKHLSSSNRSLSMVSSISREGHTAFVRFRLALVPQGLDHAAAARQRQRDRTHAGDAGFRAARRPSRGPTRLDLGV
jgi:transposase